jgi:hypothetical protein
MGENKSLELKILQDFQEKLTPTKPMMGTSVIKKAKNFHAGLAPGNWSLK